MIEFSAFRFNFQFNFHRASPQKPSRAEVLDNARDPQILGYDAKSERFKVLEPSLNITKAARRRVLNPGEPDEELRLVRAYIPEQTFALTRRRVA